MKKYSVILFTVLFTVITTIFAQIKAPSDISGKWTGKLSIQGMNLRIVFNLKQENGLITATLDSPDQGARGIKVDRVEVLGDSLKIFVPSIIGKYEGKFINDSAVSGKWFQAGMSLPLDIARNTSIKIKTKVMNPLYNEIEVKIPNSKDSLMLAGTLTIPKNAVNCPAVILVTGSGPQNRDEEILGQKPFYRIADYLSSRGIAVLRYDDRGVNESTGDHLKATTFDFTTDAKEACKFLKAQKGINPKKVGIIGHSEGGLIAPIAASETDEINFIVMLAGIGITGEEVLETQTRAIYIANGLKIDTVELIAETNQKIFEIVKKNPDNKSAYHEIEQMIQQMNIPDEAGKQLIKNASACLSPWFRQFLTIDPAIYLTKVKCPVLSLIGSKDLQVLPEPNNTAIEASLKKAKNKNFTIKELPGYNHLFQVSEKGLLSEYSNLDKPSMDDKVLEIIVTWIKNL